MVFCPVSRFYSEIQTLTILTKYHISSLRPVHPNYITISLYGLVDSAGLYYGISLKPPQHMGFNTEHLMQTRADLWGSKMSKYSSNHGEFMNLVKSVKESMRDGNLTNAEVL